MNLWGNIKVPRLGNMQFYHLIHYIEKYHNQYRTSISLQNDIIVYLDAVIYKHWNEPTVVFRKICDGYNLVLNYNKIAISGKYYSENLLDKDSYFNISLHFDLPPHEDLVKLHKLIDVGFGIMLPWNK